MVYKQAQESPALSTNIDDGGKCLQGGGLEK